MKEKSAYFLPFRFLFYKRKIKKDFSYSSRKQNDLGVSGSFPVQKQVTRARLYYLSVEMQTVPVSEVSGEESVERILPRDKC